MNNLPILSNTAQANSKTAAPNNNAPKTHDDTVQSTQPFGAVLAKQLSDKDKKDGTAMQPESVAPDVLNALPADAKINAETNANTTTPFPSDLLATLLPQTAAAVVAQMNIPLQPGMVKGNVPVEPGQAKIPVDPTGIHADVLKSSASLSAATPAALAGKESGFATALNNSADNTATKSSASNTPLDVAKTLLLPQPATPPASALPALANLNPLAAQAMPLVINRPLSHVRWGDEFSQKITWLATSSQDQSAELHLNPPQLGPLDVVLKVSGDQATALFTSSHAAVREAIEQSIPKLREMLADNGIMLGNATVSDQAPRDPRGESGGQRQTAPSGRVLEVSPSNVTTAGTAPIRRHNGVVDTFA